MTNTKQKTPQDWIIDSLIYIFKNKDNYLGDFLKDDAYKYVLKAYADKYSNSYIEENGKLFNMYWDSFSEDDIKLIRESIIVSEESVKKLNNLIGKNKTKTEFRNALKEMLHLEHLTPMRYSREKLCKLNQASVNYESVKECFKYSAIALITKDEAKKLDSKKTGGVVRKEDIDLLVELLAPKEEIIEAEKLKKDKKSLKDNGNGLLRLIHLYNLGVIFVDLNDEPIDLNCLVNMLKNNKFEIGQYAKKQIKI